MSALTPCNRCVLDNIIRREGKRAVKTEPDPVEPDFPNGLSVYVKGKAVAWLADLTEECCC